MSPRPARSRRDPAPCVFIAGCASRRVLERIADKWTALVIHALADRRRLRFGELQREIGGISQKMLTRTLRALEQDALVTRTVHAVVPPRVDYVLTKRGGTLVEPLRLMCRWAERNSSRL